MCVGSMQPLPRHLQKRLLHTRYARKPQHEHLQSASRSHSHIGLRLCLSLGPNLGFRARPVSTIAIAATSRQQLVDGPQHPPEHVLPSDELPCLLELSAPLLDGSRSAAGQHSEHHLSGPAQCNQI